MEPKGKMTWHDERVKEFLEYIGCNLNVLRSITITASINDSGILHIEEERFAEKKNG